MRRYGIHQQRGNPGGGGRGYARSVDLAVPAAATAAQGRIDADAGCHQVGRQPPVGGRSVAAEPGQIAAVERGADGQRVLRGAIVGETVDARVRLGNDIELAVAPHAGIELARADVAPIEQPGICAQAHVDDQGFDPLGHPALFAAARGFGNVFHAAAYAVTEAGARAVQHLGETDMRYGGRHARETRLDGAVSGDGAGDVGTVPAIVDPQVIGLVEGAVGAEPGGVPGEVGAADAVPVGGDIQMVDVEPGVHDGDGNRGAAGPGKDSRRGAVGAQCVGAQRRHGRVVGGLDDADGLDGQHEVGGGKRIEHLLGRGGRIDPECGVVAADDGAEALQLAPPAAAGIRCHQRNVDGRLLVDRLVEDVVCECLQFRFGGRGAKPVHRGQGGDFVQAGCIARQSGAKQAS